MKACPDDLAGISAALTSASDTYYFDTHDPAQKDYIPSAKDHSVALRELTSRQQKVKPRASERSTLCPVCASRHLEPP